MSFSAIEAPTRVGRIAMFLAQARNPDLDVQSYAVSHEMLTRRILIKLYTPTIGWVGAVPDAFLDDSVESLVAYLELTYPDIFTTFKPFKGVT